MQKLKCQLMFFILLQINVLNHVILIHLKRNSYRLYYAQEPGSKQERIDYSPDYSLLVKIRSFPRCNSIQHRIKKWPKSYWIRIPYDMKNFADLGGCYHFALSPLLFLPFAPAIAT